MATPLEQMEAAIKALQLTCQASGMSMLVAVTDGHKAINGMVGLRKHIFALLVKAAGRLATVIGMCDEKKGAGMRMVKKVKCPACHRYFGSSKKNTCPHCKRDVEENALRVFFHSWAESRGYIDGFHGFDPLSTIGFFRLWEMMKQSGDLGVLSIVDSWKLALMVARYLGYTK